ncbi:DUF4097 family beta strand repeat-containing protein [Streptomyces rimosus]|uniref:DUF4097 family beta strand repeat-containing protein n=1 Tax=Streptomyces rimosus TaxID=1927 RepID=UPI0004CC2CE9|nr:DUF4097 family beta strand repeat-containing protein [Streptomyces rimosus]
MPFFDTPEPISATLEFDIASVRITASKRMDTVVEVRPANAANETDVRAAQQTSVTCAGGKLLVKGPRKRSLFGRSGSLDVSVELPAGSHLRGASPMADFICEGVLGDCRIKTSAGDIQIDAAGTVDLRTDYGDIRVDRVDGDAEVVAAGRIELGRIAGVGTVKNANGDTIVGEAVGDLRVTSSNGQISVDVAHAGVDVKSANGGVRIGEVARGRTTVLTAAGDVEIGIRESTAAWLDLNSLGGVHSELGPAEGPGADDETVEVRARTGFGDIVIRRA